MKLLCILLISFFLVGCGAIDPKEELPSYLNIEDYQLNTTVAQGTSSNAVSELWVYVNQDVQGVFDIPSSIPVLKTGQNKVSVFAGIKNNGMGSSRIRYPFYQPYDTIVDLQPTENFQLFPRFSYYSNALINTDRDFEGGNYWIPGPNNQGNFELIIDDQISVGGDKCGKMSLTASNNYFLYIDDFPLEMESGNTVFLEMDYSCNNTFVLGAYTIDNSNQTKNQILYLTPTTTDSGANPAWNKIYIDLGPTAAMNPNADFHKLFVECVSNESSTPTIYLDNLKIVNW